jgi:hypothetical protein
MSTEDPALDLGPTPRTRELQDLFIYLLTPAQDREPLYVLDDRGPERSPWSVSFNHLHSIFFH